VDGTVERHPGFDVGYTASKPHPPAYYAATTTLHTRHRMTQCVICFKCINRKQWRQAVKRRWKLHVPDMKPDGVRVLWLKQHLPNYDATSNTSPSSLCTNHHRKAASPPTPALRRQIDAAALRLKVNAATTAKARNCDGTTCFICRPITADVVQHQRQYQQSSSNADEAPLPCDFLFTRSKRPAARRLPAPATPPSNVPSSAIAAMGVTMSGRALGKAATTLRNSGIDTASESVVRRDATERNHLLLPFFTTTECDLATDGVLYFCHDVVTVTELVLWLRGTDPSKVKMVRVSADDGRGVLKCSIQFLLSTDRVFRSERSSRRSNTQPLDTGVNRIIILSMLVGVKESFDTIRTLFDCIEWEELLQLLPLTRVEWVIPMDMKTAAFAVGVGPIGSIYPSVYNLWSMYEKHSAPQQLRTIKGILQQYKLRQQAIKSHGVDSTQAEAKLFQSVHAAPISLVQLLRPDVISDVIVPAPLHLELGIVALMYANVVVVDDASAKRWLYDAGVYLSDIHGRTSFVGKHCKTLCARATLLRDYAAIRRPAGETLTPPQRRRIEQMRTALKAIARCLTAFGQLMHHTGQQQLHPAWEAAVKVFRVEYEAQARALDHFHSVASYRNDDRHTLKVHCLVEDFPLWIKKHNCSSLRISEQSFETLHSKYQEFAARWKIPPALIPPSDTADADSALADTRPTAATSGTRSGVVTKRFNERKISNNLSQYHCSLRSVRSGGSQKRRKPTDGTI